MNDKIDKILDTVTEIKIEQASIKKDVSVNTADLAEHIRRTNILESKTQKMIYILLVVMGAAGVKWFPEIKSFIGLLI